MSQDNVAVVRALIEAANTDDAERGFALFDPAVTARIHDLPDAPEFHGHEGMLDWQRQWERSFASWRWEPQAFLPAGDRVVAILRTVARGHASGIEVERVTGAVFRVRGGRIVELDYYATKDEALAAAGLRG